MTKLNPSKITSILNELKKEKFDKAKPLLIEALSIFHVTGNDLGIGVGYYNLGDIAWWEGDVEQAKQYYQRSERTFINSNTGGIYLDAPRKRLKRIEENDPPSFVN